MIVQGLLGMYLHHGSLGKKITFSYLLTVIVGIGRLVIKKNRKEKKTMRIIVIFKPNLF
jgi:glucose uptake protein GlcU